MPNQSNNPQDYVFQTINGIKKKVKPYDLYKAMHGGDGRPKPEIHFDGEKLTLSGVDKDGNGKTYTFPARSGSPKEDGSFNYSPEYQREKNRGPIPEGDYSINPAKSTANGVVEQIRQLRPNGGLFRAGRGAWGSARTAINQSVQQQAQTGRDHMYVHGGDECGSIGCIDLKDKDKEFFGRLYELTPAPFKNQEIPLTVKYAKTKIK